MLISVLKRSKHKYLGAVKTLSAAFRLTRSAPFEEVQFFSLTGKKIQISGSFFSCPLKCFRLMLCYVGSLPRLGATSTTSARMGIAQGQG